MPPPASVLSVEESDQGPVVLKRVHGLAAATRLTREAAWLQAFAHPGVVRYVGSSDYTQSDPAHAELTTAYAGAVTLADYSPADVGSAAAVVAGVAAVVADLHLAGFTHGSITGDHVIVGKTRHPVLCSFGDAAELTSEGVQTDVAALTRIVESIVERCPAGTGRTARRQRRAIGEAVAAGHSGTKSASELAACLVAVPGGALVPSAVDAPNNAKEITRTWRDRVLPDDNTGATPQLRRAGFALWCTGLAVALWLLHITGTGELATPPAPWRWGEWFETIEPAAAVVALVRLSAIVCGWYLVVVSVVGALGHRSGTPRFVAALDRATPAFLRSLLRSAGGLTVSAAGLTLAVTPLLAPSDGAVVDVVAAEADPVPRLAQVPSPVIPAVETAPPGTSDNEAKWRSFEFRLAEFEPAEAAVVLPAVPEEWVVETGDHFWRIAHETLADDLGHEPDEGDVGLYWTSLIDANRDRLVDPGNPDLIYPGQVLVLSPRERRPGPGR